MDVAPDTLGTPPKRLLRWLATEPFIHFVLLGACIFAAYGLWGSERGAELQIRISQADQQRLRAVARQQLGKEPDTAQMRALVDQHIREEVLYREALALELQRDDIIVRRRLVQKMEYLSQEGAATASESQLRDYFARHSDRYAIPAMADLQMDYFDPARRGAKAKHDAVDALQSAKAGQRLVGDPFMLGTQLSGQTLPMLERDFGPGFAASVAKMPTGDWSGPIESVHGWHLVQVSRRQDSPAVRFEDVRERVASDLTHSTDNPSSDAAYARMRARYTVEIQGVGQQ
jgi:hypothetical protein